MAALAWRAAPEARLPHWQRVFSQLSHLALYLLLFAMTLSGWFFASMRSWTITLFEVIAIPRLVAQGSVLGHIVGERHGMLHWVLLGTISAQVMAALAHRFLFREQVMQRMLPRSQGVG